VSTTAARAERARLRVAIGADTIAVGGLGAFVAGLLAATWGTWGDLDSDTGYDPVAGMRVADGELPYRDFTYYYGPLAPLASGLSATLGGSGLAPAVALGLVVALAIVAATYGLARIVAGPLGAFLAAALTAGVAFIPNNYSFVLPHTHAATIGTLLVLGMLLSVWRYATGERTSWLITAGVCAGLATLTKPEPAMAALAAGFAWVLLRGRAGAPMARELTRFAAPALLIPAAVYGAFLTAVSPRVLLLDNLYPVDELAAGGDALVEVRMPFTPQSIASLGGKLLLYAAGATALVLAARAIDRRTGRGRRILAGALAAGGLVVALAALVKPDGVRDGMPYLFGWIPAGAIAATAVLYLRFRRREGAWSASAQVQLAAVLALAVLAGMTYNAFVFHGWRPQMGVYAAPLAAILLVQLHLIELPRGRSGRVLGAVWLAFLVAVVGGLTLRESRAESVTVRGPGGSIAAEPEQAAAYQHALDAITGRTRAGDPILVGPLMTGLYVLSERDSPLRELSLLPSALPQPADERAAVARLERDPPVLVITDDREWPGYDHGAFGATFHRRLAAWISGNYTQVQSARAGSSRRLAVWQRSAR
jgi:hypothetical protein